MSDENSLLQKIRENLDDDIPRLIYADWLEEHGEPERAEFIRIQCQLQGAPLDAQSRAALEKRETQLLETYQTTWCGKLPRDLKIRFVRGFLEVLRVSADVLLRQATRRWWEQYGHLVETLRLEDANKSQFQQIKQFGIFDFIGGLDLSKCEIDADLLEEIASLSQLSSLTLNSTVPKEIESKGVACLGQLHQLRRLNLHDAEYLQDKDAHFFEQLPHLRSFTLSKGSQFTGTGLMYLWNNKNLTELSLSHTHLTLKGTESLRHLTHLQEFSCWQGNLSDSMLQHFQGCEQLRVLSIYLNWTETGVRHLKSLPALRKLSLKGFTQSKDPNKAFCSLDLPNLECLNVWGAGTNWPSEESCRHVARFRNLREFDSNVHTIPESIIPYLAELPELRQLRLADSQVTGQALEPLRNHPHLEVLDLESSRVSDTGLKYLAEMPSLKVVDLSDTKVTKKAIAQFQKQRPDIRVILDEEE